jgi:hypothetical protein
MVKFYQFLRVGLHRIHFGSGDIRIQIAFPDLDPDLGTRY